MTPRARRALLVAHIGASVGWLGAVTASLALAVTALVTTDDDVAGAVLLVLPPLGWTALVPLSVASLATGVLQSLVSPWGLIRHYWVLIKLLMNLLAVGVLLLYTQTLNTLAQLTRDAAAGGDTPVRSASPVVHGVAAVALLLVALVLSVYKPRGQTGFGATRGIRQRVTRP